MTTTPTQASAPRLLRSEVIPIDQVIPDPENTRLHLDRSIDVLCDSLQAFGQQAPIVIDLDNICRAGNGLLRAALTLGFKEIAVIRAPIRGDDAVAYSIADNRTAELAKWDYENLAAVLASLRDNGYNVSQLGWADYELEPLFAATFPDVSTADHTINFDAQQRRAIDKVVEKLRADEGDPDLSVQRCVELVCADYIAGA